MTKDEKQCPFCAETIKVKATKCRYCGSSLSGKDDFHAFKSNRSQAKQLDVDTTDVPTFFTKPYENKGSFTGWVILGLVALVLAFTNPNEKDFKYEIVKKIQESGEIDDLNPFQKLMVGIASYAIDSVTERKNYLIFSIFEIDSSLIKIINPDTPRLKFVGIAGQIIPLFQSKSFAEDNLTTNENNTKSETEASAVIYKNDIKQKGQVNDKLKTEINMISRVFPNVNLTELFKDTDSTRKFFKEQGWKERKFGCNTWDTIYICFIKNDIEVDLEEMGHGPKAGRIIIGTRLFELNKGKYIWSEMGDPSIPTKFYINKKSIQENKNLINFELLTELPMMGPEGKSYITKYVLDCNIKMVKDIELNSFPESMGEGLRNPIMIPENERKFYKPTADLPLIGYMMEEHCFS